MSHRPSAEILKTLTKLETEIQQGMKELEGMLKWADLEIANRSLGCCESTCRQREDVQNTSLMERSDSSSRSWFCAILLWQRMELGSSFCPASPGSIGLSTDPAETLRKHLICNGCPHSSNG